jgi:hypothetical protein
MINMIDSSSFVYRSQSNLPEHVLFIIMGFVVSNK